MFGVCFVNFMRFYICIVAIAGFLGMCERADAGKFVGNSSQIIEYQIDEKQYAVVVVMDGISASQAKKMAMQRAAEIVVEGRDRYFTVDSEQETEVVKSEGGQNAPRNLYQEVVIEGEFNRERLRDRSVLKTELYPAIRLVFTSYKQKPHWKAIDACTLTPCNGGR